MDVTLQYLPTPDNDDPNPVIEIFRYNLSEEHLKLLLEVLQEFSID